MSYHDLSTCTLTADERRAEADRIVGILAQQVSEDELTDKENQFLEGIVGNSISAKQLFWLRDILLKYT
jgi:hypothetical protein